MELQYHIHDILNAYRAGLFPMAEDAGVENFFFFEPEQRGLLPIHELHVPRSLARMCRRGVFKVRADYDFTDVIDGCAEAREERPKTWINRPIRDIFVLLHQAGYAHCISCYNRSDDSLAGGLYGLALGGLFCGESMFSYQSNASKVALVHLMARLWAGGFSICDTQFLNPHLIQFGAFEIPQKDYLRRIQGVLSDRAHFHDLSGSAHYRPGENIQDPEIALVRAYLDWLRARGCTKG